MLVFRGVLVAVFLCLTAYTVQVVTTHGLGLFAVFFGDMAKFGWAGQFNADFMAMLAFSGAWVIWRNQFSALGFALGVLAFFGGAPFLCGYLLYLSIAHDGDVTTMLVGENK